MKRILPLLVALIAAPLAAFIPLTNSVRTGPATFPQYNAAIASDGFDYLAAWIEKRQSGSAVYAVCIEADGTVNGPAARAIDPAGPFLDVETHPHALSLTPGRDGYFLSWLSDTGLMVAITDSYGAVKRRVTVPQPWPAVQTIAAWNGNTYLVLSGFATTFSATLFDNNAQVVKSQIPVGDTHGDYYVRTAVTADDNGFLVVSTNRLSDHIGIYGRRISSSGTTGDWFLIREGVSPYGLAVTFDGSRDVVVWSDFGGIWSIPVDSHSDASGAARQWISATIIELSNAIWALNRLWIGYTTTGPYDTSYYITVTPEGTVSPAVAFDSAYGGPKLAASSARVLALRAKGRTGDLLVASFVTPDAAGSDISVAYHQTVQQNGSLVTDGQRLLTTWDEVIAPDDRIYASIIDTMHRDQIREIEVTRGARDRRPVAAFNGSEYLIVWERTDDTYATGIFARRLSVEGALIESEIDFGSGSQPRVATDGTNWLVLRQQRLGSQYPSGDGLKLLATRVSPAGAILDPGGVIIVPGSDCDQADADIVWSGTQYVVAWAERCAGYSHWSSTSIRAATLTPDLKTTSTWRVSGYGFAQSGTSVTAPRLTATNERILVAWNVFERKPEPQYQTKSINYRLITGSVANGGRRRAAALRTTDTGSIDATLLGVALDATGRPFILGRMQIPTSADDGLYRWNIDDSGAANNIGLRFTFSPDETLMGTPVLLGPTWWIPESRFLPDAGAYRLFARDFQ